MSQVLGRQTDVVFLDFAKAFDRVPDDILLQKLFNLGMSGFLLNWCANYLSDRYQRVVIDDQHSSWSNVTSRIPQGFI